MHMVMSNFVISAFFSLRSWVGLSTKKGWLPWNIQVQLHRLEVQVAASTSIATEVKRKGQLGLVK